MDTIVYVYPLREEKEELYTLEELDMPDYHLVRAGISKVLAELMGGRQCRNDAVVVQSAEAQKKRSSFGKRENFWRRCRRKKQQQLQQQWEQAVLEEFLNRTTHDTEHSFLVGEEALPFLSYWEFNGYFEADWVKHMLWYGTEQNGVFVTPHFLVFGQAHCLPEILYPNAAKMKSLKWVLPARQFRAEQQELVEDIYDEYGLAVDVHLLEDEDAYRRTRISCAIPTIVLDFSESDRVPTADIAKGSIWLDMASSEEKRRRIEERNTGIHYFSLKKEWKQPRKALFYLDTTSKNGYNT